MVVSGLSAFHCLVCSLLDDHDVQVIKPSRITYSRNQLMTIKLFGNDPDTVPDLPASLKKCT